MRSSTTAIACTPAWTAARLELLTRTGLDWTHKYPPIAAALSVLPLQQASFDGELCGIRPDGKTSFSLIQAASDMGNAGRARLLHVRSPLSRWRPISSAPLLERKERLRDFLSSAGSPLQYSDHQIGRGPEFYARVCELPLEGIISKRADAPYAPGNRSLWVKVKCLNREEFVVVGWTDPEGSRPRLGALLLAYYAPDGRLVYAGRAGVGINNDELERLWRRLQPLATSEMPLDVPPPPDQPLWLAACPQPRALGSTRACGRGEISNLDGRQPASPGDLSGLARGQRSNRRPPSRAEPLRVVRAAN
jgi:ATP-dependent DNA ligase